MKQIALYDPYLDTMGGGERHILSILKALEDKGALITVFWDKDLQSDIKKNLGLHFRTLRFAPNIFKRSRFEKTKLLSQHDMFFYVTDGSYFFSPSAKNFVFCMVPNPDLYRMGFMNKIKTQNFSFITNSLYTQNWLSAWGVKSEVIYPYIDDSLLSIDVASLKKERFILSVGRFFSHLHSKRQDVLIRLFLEAKKRSPSLADYKLILAGGLMPDDEEYFNSLKKLAGGDTSIVFYPNISHAKLLTLYKKSRIYWHAAGYEADEKKYPDRVEHLGITPLEAMSAGCLCVCYRAGGPKEIIEDGVNGFLFENDAELINKTESILNNKEQQKMITENAKEFVTRNFSYTVFKERVYEVFT